MTALNPLTPDTDQLIVVMQTREVFRFTFLYTADGRMRVITVEPSRTEAGDLLVAISEALKVGKHRQDSTLAVRDATAVAVYIAELIRERDNFRVQCKGLLDQVQCLQWDLNALQARHDLCTERPEEAS
ncbi:hypothetical protein OHB26_24755 [Nocardia sp. NBC_01503]|uniref:hypothetical protein n=1 Tax=Nocardia sp. NBC_01503 TaxID=2975997 RepID=UPI002E7BF1CF|nr:hypothetical protein [Nocardia sp. NBC_01503]WTL30151.1 hypothetical protein OHB26_24755 [Nocardia sp. NBC_01503]